MNLEPETRAQALAQQGEAERLGNGGKELGQQGKFEEPLTRFQQASRLDPSLKLDPQSEVKKLTPIGLLSQMESFSAEHQFQEAMAAYTKAITLDPNVELSSDTLSSLCWDGSLNDFSQAVLPACEKAVLLSPKAAETRDNRSLARAPTGNTKGAIEDFQVFMAQTEDRKAQLQRQRWLKTLRAGKNPFTLEELKSLRG
ncbi:hypothetical protein H6F86_13645 [Phormidium sp. FACHB-592]|uniref:Tetratricopeptide repeat protein n=1 Tax=Stenomitos frigidus AS-A4 TaxID=2933935 RepID=A0ABV0KPM1_9CYAN|nr:hypothetical protein [Phormidium sp. FACHB-592]MBD2074920.1 hypothetical protein [Phormidium sp. FACHB-592]